MGVVFLNEKAPNASVGEISRLTEKIKWQKILPYQKVHETPKTNKELLAHTAALCYIFLTCFDIQKL